METDKFKKLFKKYRLKAEFSTLSELSLSLAEKGLLYEESIFSHWQKGTRVPQSRNILIKLIEIFVERDGMTTLAQANEFLSSANQGYLTEDEIKKLKLDTLIQSSFQLPAQIAHFTGRDGIIQELKKHIAYGKTFILHGSPGVGKSVLAIQLGYLLKNIFPDGVLYYRLDTSDVMDILLSIAFTFGRDASQIPDKEIRASFVRSILSKKKVLLIFDNAEKNTDFRLLLPNTEYCSVLITSVNSELPIPVSHEGISVSAFTQKETLSLFKIILGKSYIQEHSKEIMKLAGIVGHFPLVLHIFANEIKRGSVTIFELIEKTQQELPDLEDFSYEDKNLYTAIDLSCRLLDEKSKKILFSLSVFNGKDFSIDAVGYINDLPVFEIKSIIDRLVNVSLLEKSIAHRYRIHPMIKKFIQRKSDNPIFFSKAAKYYKQFLSKFDAKLLKSYPNLKQESETVLFIFKKCYELHYWDDVIALWNPLESLLYATHQLSKMRYMYQIARTQKTGINKLQIIAICLLLPIILYWIWLNLSGMKTSSWNYFDSFLVGVIPIIGSITGIFISRKWGFGKSLMGRAVLFLSAGLLSWGMGNLIWSYYNFFQNISVPYPSLADIGFSLSYPLWTIGMINLPHAIGAKFDIRKKYGKLFIIVIPLFVLTLSYCLLVYITKSTTIFNSLNPSMKLFFDVYYPLSDVVILTAALILGISFKFFGGKYKISIYSILLGFCFQYFGDFLFTYTTTNNSYFNGNIADLMFTISLFCITFGVLGFYFKPENKL